MHYLLQGIVLFFLLLAGLVASSPILFVLEGIYRVVANKPKAGGTSFLPGVATIIALPLITLFNRLPALFPAWMLKAAVGILLLDFLLIVPLLVDLGWQKLRGK